MVNEINFATPSNAKNKMIFLSNYTLYENRKKICSDRDTHWNCLTSECWMEMVAWGHMYIVQHSVIHQIEHEMDKTNDKVGQVMLTVLHGHLEDTWVEDVL